MSMTHPTHPQAEPAANDPTRDRAASGARSWADEEAELAAEQIAMLRNLSRRAMTMAEDIQLQAADRAAREKEDGIERTDLSLAFARTARSARQSMMLASKFAAARRKGERDDAAEQARQAAAARHKRKGEEKQRIERAVEQAIDSDKRLSETAAETAREDLRERLESPEFYEEFGETPAEILIAKLCLELELEPDWADWAAKAAAEKAWIDHWESEAAVRAAAASETTDNDAAGMAAECAPGPAAANDTLSPAATPEPGDDTAAPEPPRAATGPP